MTTATRALPFAVTLALAAAFVVDGHAQGVKANFVAQGSFDLGTKGQPGVPDRPAALALGPNGVIHLTDERGVVHVYEASGTHRRVYGQGQLKKPVAIAVDADGIAFVLDSDHKQVLVFGVDGTPLRTVGEKGDGGGKLSDPVDLAVGPSGHLYVLDSGQKNVQVFSYDGTLVRQIPLGETLKEPLSLAVGNDGALYIGDKRTPTHAYAFPPFTEIPWAGTLPRGLAGRVSFRGAQLDEPVALAVNDRGTLVVLDKETGRLFRKNAWDNAEIGPNDLLYGGIGTGRGSFREPVDIAYDGSDELLILDRELRKVERIRLTTEAELRRRPDMGFPIRVTTVPGDLPEPLLDVGVDANGAARFLLEMEKSGASLVATRAEPYTTVYGDAVSLYQPDPASLMRSLTQEVGEVGAAALTDSTAVIIDSKRDRFAIFETASGRLIGTFGDTYQDDRKLRDPGGVAVLPDGRIVIADTGNNRVKIFSSDLASLVAAYPVNKPVGVALSPDSEIFVWNEDGTVVGKLDPNEERLDPLPPPLVPGPIAALTFDEAGNLFLLDANSHRVTIIEEGLDRILTQVGAEGALDKPNRINVDQEGNIYISDEGARRTAVYRWDVSVPPLSGFDLTYEGDVAVLEWQPGPARYTRGYEIQGADSPDGPFYPLARAETSTYRLDPANQPESPPRYVRVAPVFTTGVRGRPTETLPLSYFAAVAAYQEGDYEGALREAVEGMRLIDEGLLDASDDAKGKILRVGFASTYQLGDYRNAVTWAQRAAAIPMPREDLIEFLFMLADLYIKVGEPREASQQILTLVGQGPRPEYYQRTEVIQQSFVIYRQLRGAGYPEDGLEFLRLYAQSIPEAAPESLHFMYEDSITVYATRDKLGPGLDYWKSANYSQVVNFFEGLLAEGGLSAEQRVISWQILAAAYYAFGRRTQAEDTFRQVYSLRSNFNLNREIPRLQSLYGLTIYNPETRQYFGNIGPR